jgi:hypothetical protein
MENITNPAGITIETKNIRSANRTPLLFIDSKKGAQNFGHLFYFMLNVL